MRTRPSSDRLRPRRHHAPCIALALALLASAPGSAMTAPPPPTPAVAPRSDVTRAGQDMRIIAFGSSSTEGVGASSPAASYPARLERIFADTYKNGPVVQVVNRGVGGEDTGAMLRRLRTDILARRPDLVIWQVGSNDALLGDPVEHFVSQLREGIGAIRDAGAEVVLMEPQWSPRIDHADAASRFVDAVREVGAQEHVDVVRRFELMHRWMDEGVASRTDLIGPDGLHMTDRGYDLLAQAVFKELAAHSPRLRDRIAVATKHP